MTAAANTPYRAIFCDLRTDTVFDILPLQDVTLDDYIGKPGSLTGTIPIPDPAIAERVSRIEEGRTSVYLERGGDLWWGGIVWTSTLASTDRGIVTLEIQAATFDSYANRRIIRTGLSWPGTGSGTDQLEIARLLWQALQGQLPETADLAGGDIGVTYGTESSAFLRNPVYVDGDETTYYDALSQLAALNDGFEHRIAVYRDPVTSGRVRRLSLGCPIITTGSTDLVLDMPGSILAYAFPRDATRGGTTAVARGASDNTDSSADSRPTLSDEQVADDLIAAGWPRVDLTADYNDVTDTPTLNSLAQSLLRQSEGAVVIPEITIRLDDLVPPQLLGRTARIRITDVWYGDGFDVRYRIIGAKVTPPQRGRPDTADLYLEEVV
jgi:hypothetical protein